MLKVTSPKSKHGKSPCERMRLIRESMQNIVGDALNQPNENGEGKVITYFDETHPDKQQWNVSKPYIARVKN